jgi:hypothetical protein
MSGRAKIMARRFSAALLEILLLAGVGLGQSFYGTLGGTVTDSSGAPVLKATVKLTEMATGVSRASVTNTEGYYLFPDLPPGTYQVIVLVAGFKEVRSSAITLTAQQSVRFDAKLEVGNVTETLVVQASAPTLNTENAQLGDVRPRDELLNVPVNTRSTLALLFLSSTSTQGDGSSFQLGGLRGQNTNFTIDGVSSNSSIFGGQVGPMTEESLESVRELKLLDSNNSAEFPNVGSVIISGRSGENQFHGSGFYETSNYALNAKDYFSPTSKPEGFYRHKWGGSIGGPVLLPHYDGHNRTFFYFTFEQGRFPEVDPTTGYVPTANMQKGNFAELLPDTPIIDPATGLPFPGNIIPVNRISPVALKFQSFGFLQPNTADPAGDLLSGAGNWKGSQPVGDHDNRWVGRGDHKFSDHDTLTGRVSVRQIPEPPQYNSDLTIFQFLQHRHTNNISLSETHVFNSRLVNEARFGYSTDYSTISGVHNGAAVVSQTGLQGINANPTLTGVPQIFFNNFSGMSEFPTYFWRSKTFDLLDNLTWAHGRHTIKSGVLIRKNLPAISDTDALFKSDFGSMNFNGFATGYDYADFLLGLPHDSERFVRSRPSDYRYTNAGLFVQDDFHVTRDLTLNLGLRWEYFAPPVDVHDQRFGFDLATGNLVVPNQTVINTLVSPVFPSSIPIVTAQAAGFPDRSLLNSHWKNFGPRIGFAYRLLGGRTVVRGGYGIYYSPLVDTLLSSFRGGPFHSDEFFLNSITGGVPRFQFPNPFPGTGSIPTQSISPAAKSLRTPYVQQWNLTVERELPGRMVGRITYRRFLSLQLPYVADLNTPPPSTNPANVNLFKYSNFFNVYYAQDAGIQKMNAMDLGLERKFTSGLSLQFGWTWAKNLSDVGDDGETSQASSGTQATNIENPYNRAAEMGNVQFTPRHRVVGEVFYELPFGTGKRFGAHLPGYAQQILGNWQVSVVSLFQTGQFLTPYFCGSDPTNTRTLCGRPDRAGNGNLAHPTIQQWFDKTAFTTPPVNAGRFGNGGRGILVGPGTVNQDFGLFKTFPVHEKYRLQVRMTATNFFNHPNFAIPRSMNIGSSRFGVITRMQGRRGDTLGAASRVIMMGLRLDF